MKGKNSFNLENGVLMLKTSYATTVSLQPWHVEAHSVGNVKKVLVVSDKLEQLDLLEGESVDELFANASTRWLTKKVVDKNTGKKKTIKFESSFLVSNFKEV